MSPIQKPTHEEIVEAAADSLSTYFGTGASFAPIIQDLDPRINIEDLPELLEYYFLLTGTELSPQIRTRADATVTAEDTAGITDPHGTPVGVCDFVSLLPHRLRTVDPAIRQELQIHTGEIDGHIDWQQTLKHRHTTGDFRGQTYACRTQERTVQTTKNKVLVELLATIQDILQRFDQAIDAAPAEFEWFDDWLPDRSLRTTLDGALDNVYLSELDYGGITVDHRAIQEVLSDRHPLYREAATLLATLRQLRREITEQQAKDLLQMDLFAPAEDETADLFELYWIFELLDQFDVPQFKQIRGEERGELIASWETNGFDYLLFNDWNGIHEWSDGRGEREYLKIQIDWPDTNAHSTDSAVNHFLQRRAKIYRRHFELSKDVFDIDTAKGGSRKYPDIVLLKLDPTTEPPTLKRVFIGEVKHSVVRHRLKDGLLQLLEYGAHAMVGPDLRVERADGWQYLASEADPLTAPEIELGYFIGHPDKIKAAPPPGIDIYGFGDRPARPFTTDTDQ